MDILYTVEEKYLQAMDELNYGETPKAMHLLKELIAADDTYGRAHYGLATIYHYYIKDYKAAGYYYQTGMDLDENFPDLYEDYLKLLVILQLHKKIEQVSAKALEVPGINLARIYEMIGVYEEQRQNFALAKQHYQKAALITVVDNEHDLLQGHLKRVSGKLKAKQQMVYAYEGS